MNWLTDVIKLQSDTVFSPLLLPIASLTHIFYAFADVYTDGSVNSGNPLVDTQFAFTASEAEAKAGVAAAVPGDRDSRRAKRQGTNVQGAVQQLYNFKTQQRNLKVLLSIGSGSSDANFTAATSTPTTRAAFASTALGLITDWGMDGIDIDWEYPNNATDRANYVALVAAVRAAFDNYTATYALGYQFLVSVVLPVSPVAQAYYDIPAMNLYVNNW